MLAGNKAVHKVSRFGQNVGGLGQVGDFGRKTRRRRVSLRYLRESGWQM